MPRIITYETLPSGVQLRKVKITWTREECLKRIRLVPTLTHKKFIAKQYRKRYAT